MLPKDPIVAEVRRIRAAFAEKFGGDLAAMVADIRTREQPHRIVDRAKLLAESRDATQTDHRGGSHTVGWHDDC